MPVPEIDPQTGIRGYGPNPILEQAWPRPDGAEGDICTTVFKVVVLNEAFSCAICRDRIPEGLPLLMVELPNNPNKIQVALCPKHVRAMGRVLANEYDRLYPAPVVPASRDEIEGCQDEGVPWLTECPKCGRSQFTTTYRTYADGTDELTRDNDGNVADVKARFPRMPDQDPGDLASIQCEDCMEIIWSNPYL